MFAAVSRASFRETGASILFAIASAATVACGGQTSSASSGNALGAGGADCGFTSRLEDGAITSTGCAPETGGAHGTKFLGATCHLNSDCVAPLVCALGFCRNQCDSSRDCPIARRCLVAVPVDVCSIPFDDRCTYNSQCPTDLICTVDQRCRNQCRMNGDCATAQLCVSGACADPTELTNDGGLSAP
jgi:hypothetical protein